MARDAMSRRSRSSRPPSRLAVWPVARMSTLIMDPNRFVDTARREPLGISFTCVTSSMPMPGPATRASTSAKACPAPSNDGGTSPEAMTPALSRLR